MANDMKPLAVGDMIPGYTTDTITRTTLALFAGASGDHNRIHIDSDFAKAVGAGDVFAQGMLPMAYLARVLTDLVPQTAIRKFSCRFRAITRVGDKITCSGEVVEAWSEGGEAIVKLALLAVDTSGDVKLAGEAVVAVAQES